MNRIAGLVAAIDEFMGKAKLLHGATSPVEWQPGRNNHERKAVFPIEVDGELRGQNLQIIAFPLAPSLEFVISLIFPPAISRLEFDPDVVHGNNLAHPLDYVEPIVRGPHFHSWEKNRRFVTGTNTAIKLHNAEKIDKIRRFDQALRWFCGTTNIVLPANHTIDLPPRDRFL